MRRSKGAYLFDDLVGIRGAKRYGTFGRVRPSHHCALMLAARTTLPHFSVSSAMSLPKSAGEPASTDRCVVQCRHDPRRSTVAILGSGAALLSPAFAPDRLQRAPRTQVVVPGGRGPEPPGTSGYKPPPQDATPRSAFRIVSRTRPQ